MEAQQTKPRSSELFNSPTECGVRALLVLWALYPDRCDLWRLTVFDYLVVHSGDVDGGPPSTHPGTPEHGAELSIRRQLLQDGLSLLQTKGLVETCFGQDGVTYLAGEQAPGFLGSLNAPYWRNIGERAAWLRSTFADWPDDRLRAYIDDNIAAWGTDICLEPTDWETSI